MKKENILVIAIICIAMGSIMAYHNLKSGKPVDPTPGKESVQAENISGIDWQSYSKGTQLAKTNDKQIFLYFHADWCTYCKKLKKTTFRNKAVLTYLKDNFISIIVDTEKDKKLAAQWRVKGLPTLWFLESDSSRISSIPGFVDAKQFLQILKYIHTASYDKMSFSEFVKTI